MLCDIIEPDFHWHDLEEVVLCGIAGDRADFMNFFLRHKDKLFRICLEDVTLISTSWKKLLADMRRNLCLHDASIRGQIYGTREDEDDPQGLMGDMLDFEYWSISPYDLPDRMRDSINMYCQKGGNKYPQELPLCDHVVDKYYKEYVQPSTWKKLRDYFPYQDFKKDMLGELGDNSEDETSATSAGRAASTRLARSPAPLQHLHHHHLHLDAAPFRSIPHNSIHLTWRDPLAASDRHSHRKHPTEPSSRPAIDQPAGFRTEHPQSLLLFTILGITHHPPHQLYRRQH
ncbi:hypothetical protein F5Y08DRAFT_345024 [Xylaria arbuscula]|nr:hypothetical protein F5Y08DRAFT_345024 [Xylaria arbuscula]